MFNVKGKIVLITGGTKGIGAGISEIFAQNGANVVIVSRNQMECEDKARELKQRFGVEAYAHSCDVQSKASVELLVHDTVKKFGKIDVTINNAGTSTTKPTVDLEEAEWDRIVGTNLKGVFLLCQAVGKQMIAQGYGKIINIASMFGLVGNKAVLPYVSSKGGVVQMTRGLALKWAANNIQVNAVAPGYVITDINREKLSNEEIRQQVLSKTPLHRFGTVQEIASTVLYLASDEASYITGAIYSVDGGWTAQ